MDGPDVVAAAFGKSAGGVCIAGRVSGAVDDQSAVEASQGEEDELGVEHIDFEHYDARVGPSRAGHKRSRTGGRRTERGRKRSGNKMTPQVWIAILVGVAATADDLRRRQIANWIPATALVSGFAWQISQGGWRGGLNALGGTASGFVVFLVFYLLGGMGGGDVKLMAGFGALLGIRSLLEASLWTAGIGGLMAVAVLAVRPLWKMLRKKKESGESPSGAAVESSDSIPYAPAITLGVWLSLVPKG
jgi:prepilin peptidase CpaA